METSELPKSHEIKEDIIFSAEDIGRKTPVNYFERVKDTPFNRLRDFLIRYRRIVIISVTGVILVGLTTIAVIIIAEKTARTEPKPNLISQIKPQEAPRTIADEVGSILSDNYEGTFEDLEKRILEKINRPEDMEQPDHVSNIVDLANLYQHRRSFQKGVDLINHHLEKVRTDTERVILLIGLYELHTGAERLDDRIKVLEKIVAFGPEQVKLPAESWAEMVRPTYVEKLEELKKQKLEEQSEE